MSESSTFIRELRRRKVFRTAVVYVIAAWVILQVADLAFPGLGVPEDAIRYVWFGAFLGFPLALIFGWIYQITSDGITHTQPLGAGETVDVSLKGMDYVLLTALLVVVGAITLGLLSEIRDSETANEIVSGPREIHPNSIAILPLNNLTGDPEQDYFVDGMHETLTAVMAQISALRVISRTSTDVYRAVTKPLPEIARELRVAHIIEGSVLRSGDRVQITLQLIDGETDEHIWAENYERDLKDILTLQAEVARTVAERISVRLTLDEEQRLADTREVNPETYRAYLRGIYHLNQFTPEGFQKGLGYLHEAVINDPGDPLAYAALARGYALIGHSPNPPPNAWATARSTAMQALQLDPNLAEAHTAMAEIKLYYDWDWDGARESFEKAIELNPSQDWAHAHYGWYFQLTGDADRAIEEMKKAYEIGPLMPLWPTWIAWLYWGENDLDAALAYAKKAQEINPGFPWGMYVLGGVQGAMGQYEESLAQFERLRPFLPNVANWGFAITYIQMGRHDDAIAVAAELAENPGQKDKMFLGMIHGTLGNKDEALKWMQAAYDSHTDWFPWAGSGAGSEMTRRLEILADEPRFQAMIDSLNLPVASPDYD